MTTRKIFTHFNAEDCAALVEVARRMGMSQSEVLRCLVRMTLGVLKEREQQAKTENDKRHIKEAGKEAVIN
jgi:DNA-binding IclR family transcriptional regulator